MITTKLIGSLRSLTDRFPLIGLVAQRVYFLTQWAAHRKLIASYKRRHYATELGRIVDTPLLIGYFETDFGLGEHAKGLAAALDAAGTPFSVYPYNGFTGRSRSEAPLVSRYDVDDIHLINIFCMATNQTRNARALIGRRHFEKSYNILIAPWEMPRAPNSWRGDLDAFDEFWAPSDFVANAFRPIFSKPILVIPPCINLDADFAPDRQKLGLGVDTFYFMFSFDFNSRPQRKNPVALISAFELAFGGRQDNVGLILKISGEQDRYPNEMKALEAAARRDRRIKIMRGDWKRADMLTLLASADCYVSLHRSEGFGMGMAESMLLGKPVIGTGFSGNTDFLTAETGYPVPYTLRPVGEGEYPHHQGNSWAEPDANAAAEIMRHVATKSEDVRQKALAGQAFIQQHYSPQAVGLVIGARIRALANAPQ